MKHLDLFTGILGNALAAKWCWGEEYENVGFCEIDWFPQAVIRKYFPNAAIHEDIRTLDPSEIGPVDLITAGVPCQPASTAGKRKGKADDRWLWPRTLEIVRAIKPKYVLFENPPGIFSLDGGLPLNDVFLEVEAAGYETVPIVLPAASVGAPHLRYRLWIVAYANELRLKERLEESGSDRRPQDHATRNRTEKGHGLDDFHQVHETAAHPDSDGYRRPHGLGEDTTPEAKAEGQEDKRQRIRSLVGGSNQEHSDARGVGWELPRSAWEWRPGLANRDPREWPQIAAELCSLDDGLSDRLVRLPGGRKISGKSWRKKAIEAIGNSVDPFVPYQIFKAIKEMKT